MVSVWSCCFCQDAVEAYVRQEPHLLDDLARELLRGSDTLVLETFLLQRGGRHVAYWAHDGSRRGVSMAVTGGIARIDAARLLAGRGTITRPEGLVPLCSVFCSLWCLCAFAWYIRVPRCLGMVRRRFRTGSFGAFIS